MTLQLEGLEGLAERYDAFLVDQFGVLLHGAGAYPYAPEALSRLAKMGKTILLLSNSGKRSGLNEDRLTRLGFERKSYLNVLSSGEAAYHELERRIGDVIAPGTRVWAHARDEDASHIAGLDLVPVEIPADAGLIVMSGCRPDIHSLDDYRAMLAAPAEAGVVCLCTNPDMTMMTEHGLSFSSGRVAALYAEMGGPVDWIGKPYPMIYKEARRRLDSINPAKIVCIGDSPAHDIAGGRDAGFATALVRTGLHEALSLEELEVHCKSEGNIPDFMIPKFDFRTGD